MRFSTALARLLGLTLPLVGCGPFGPGGDDDDDATGDDDDDTGPPGPVDTTIQALNAGDIADDTEVTVEGVVTTPLGMDEGDNAGWFWIAEAAGGPGSGMYVYTFYDVITEIEDGGEIGPGTIVAVTGRFQHAFEYELPEIVIDATTDVEVTGTGPLPEPYVVEVDDVTGGFADASLWGAIVAVENVVVDAAPTYESYNEWSADGVMSGDMFYYPDVELDYEIELLAGVLTPWYGDAMIFPRWSTDLGFSYPGCDDGLDGTTVQGVRCRAVDEDDEVTLSGLVVVSGAPWYGDAFWAQDPTQALFGGIQIFSVFDGLDIPDLGSVITVTGEYETYRGAAEIILFSSDDLEVTGAGTAEPLDLVSACDVTEAHEGMLVRIEAVEVDALGNGGYPVVGCANRNVGSAFWADATAFEDETGGAGDIVDLVGVVTDRFEDLTINPRDTDDWASWTSTATVR